MEKLKLFIETALFAVIGCIFVLVSIAGMLK